MKLVALFVCLSLLGACRKDPALVYDNFIQFDGTIYFSPKGSKDIHSNISPYHTFVYWIEQRNNTKTTIAIENNCDNNRGVLSNYRGSIDFRSYNGKDSVRYFGIFPVFELHQVEKNIFMEYRNFKIYRDKHFGYGDLDYNDYKIVSGRATFQ